MDWPYIAGFFDGEGCVSLTGKQLNLLIAQTIGSNSVLKRIAEFCASHGVRTHLRGPYKLKNPNSKPIERLAISDFQSCKVFIENTLPFLIVKKYQAEFALSHLIENHSPRILVHKSALDDAINEYQSGESFRAISIKYGISTCGIQYHMKLRGLTWRTRSETWKLIARIPNRKYRTVEVEARMNGALKDYRDGYSMVAAAKRNHTTFFVFRAWLRKNNFSVRSTNEAVTLGQARAKRLATT